MVSGEKRNNEDANLVPKISIILLDIEGTTTSVSFVKDNLFPYVEENLESYLESHWNEPELQEDIKLLKEQAKTDEEAKVDGFCPIEEGEKERETLMKNVLWQMSIDRKTTALKRLQGHIWRDGYKDGRLKGHVYGDVAPMLKKWSEDGRKIYIFSSGSVEAQKLLFGHSEEGNLLPYISGHFDTSVGPKTESNSYSSIIKSVECEKENVLFLTDVVKEAQAARAAGMGVGLVLREGNAPVTDEERQDFGAVTTFGDVVFENSSKRKKVCDSPKEEEPQGSNLPDREQKPESNAEAAEEKCHVNGMEEMEVDRGDETKSETAEPDRNDTEKTASNEKKTDYETKTDSEDVEIHVASEEKNEGNVETSGDSSSSGVDDDGTALPEGEAEGRKGTETNGTDGEAGEKVSDSGTDSDTRTDAIEATSENGETSQPFDSKVEGSRTSAGEGLNSEVDSTKNRSWAEVEEDVEEEEDEGEEVIDNNGVQEETEKRGGEIKVDAENEEETATEKETNSTAEKVDSTENSSPDKKNQQGEDTSKSPETSAARKEARGECPENSHEELGMKSIVAEDKPEQTVEVKA